MVLRACERIDPRAVFGRPWSDLQVEEQWSLMGYDKVRRFEETEELTLQMEARRV